MDENRMQPADTTTESAAAESEVSWDTLSADEQAALQAIIRGEHINDDVARLLIDKGLAIIAYDQESCPHVDATLKGERVLAQAAANAGGQGAAKFTDNELLLLAEVARLRGVLRTIADYEDVESDMEEWHQREGMKQQAENALEIPPPPGGILSTLVSRNETLKAENARLQTALAASQQAWDTSETQWVHMARLLEMPYEETAPLEMVARVAELIADEIAVRSALASAEARADGLREELQALTCRGSVIDWAIEAVAVWNHFVSTTDSDAPVSEALAITLNVLDSKTTEYQRVRKANPHSYGGSMEE